MARRLEVTQSETIILRYSRRTYSMHVPKAYIFVRVPHCITLSLMLALAAKRLSENRSCSEGTPFRVIFFADLRRIWVSFNENQRKKGWNGFP